MWIFDALIIALFYVRIVHLNKMLGADYPAGTRFICIAGVEPAIVGFQGPMLYQLSYMSVAVFALTKHAAFM